MRMGGIGSGQGPRPGRRRSKPLIGIDLLRLDIRELDREQFLLPGKQRDYCWTGYRDGAAVQIAADDACHNLTLSYLLTEPGSEPVAVDERIELIETTTFHEVELQHFICPGCDAQVRILLGPRFRCRRCHNAAYPSQYDTPQSREARQGAELRAKLRTEPHTSPFCMPKPRYMHWKTYTDARDKLQRLQINVMLDHLRSTDRAYDIARKSDPKARRPRRTYMPQLARLIMGRGVR